MKLLCTSLFLALLALSLSAEAAPDPAQAIETTTANGDKILLHPNGKWEYVDQVKKAEADKIAKQYPENQGCPPGTQGGVFGVGRCIPPGDKDFNRGSMSGKGR
ncbi:hypothetical protein SAMN05192560_1703 [Methylobacillus rhizosphaerae]|uniref:Uncharacterized protein n=1 Tax=Methylobacillus rhizosphaerae TaxID=551994 RepID=A0A239A4Z8_9PROT|nr:hypothetical protein [Methylobacillus rhizosphaerae]SNR90727.1 hypothetical protein SAMN05192560_1703 [Methylobacillus rhizosphaerae]